MLFNLIFIRTSLFFLHKVSGLPSLLTLGMTNFQYHYSFDFKIFFKKIKFKSKQGVLVIWQLNSLNNYFLNSYLPIMTSVRTVLVPLVPRSTCFTVSRTLSLKPVLLKLTVKSWIVWLKKIISHCFFLRKFCI